MPMTPFLVYYPELAARETRTLTVQGRADLPDGEYGFFELYCDEPDCDCRRVLLQVRSAVPPHAIFATIGYGWEDPAFYARRFPGAGMLDAHQGASLDPLNPQSVYASTLLGIFVDVLLQDRAYVERLKRHYALVKEAVRRAPARRKPAGQPRRRR